MKEERERVVVVVVLAVAQHNITTYTTNMCSIFGRNNVHTKGSYGIHEGNEKKIALE
jgi:predicted ThiF/HesA family dinucleotide-utilizing enzyme